MPIAWFIVPFKIDTSFPLRDHRYVAIDDFSQQITAAGGDWTGTEILGDRAICKVRATTAQLSTLASQPGYKRLPKDRLDDSLADLSTAVKQAIKNEVLNAGYTLAEISTRFPGDLGDYTLRDVLHFMASRRLKPHYDREADEILLNGVVQECRPVQEVEEEISE